MFICEKCLEKFNNWGIMRSYGRCEICGEVHSCYDIPSRCLELKDEYRKEYKNETKN